MVGAVPPCRPQLTCGRGGAPVPPSVDSCSASLSARDRRRKKEETITNWCQLNIKPSQRLLFNY
ncbi:MAG: hypothetical protein HC849_06720 [Oscillatoriales cyanobacterium RU_3_3]|nr:hypothetical protein [Oscillatoriales cyanobacterium RU_3_3]